MISRIGCARIVGFDWEMTNKSFEQSCAVSKTLDIVGERWTLLIVRELLAGSLRFQDIQSRLPGLAASLLSSRLKTLESAGVIQSEAYSKHPPRAAYKLSEKGRELGLIVGAMGRWGARHLDAKMSKLSKHSECGHVVEVRHYCLHCQTPIRAKDVIVIEAARRKMD